MKNRHINHALIKTAFRYNKPGHFKKFRLLDDEEMVSAAFRQGPIRRILRISSVLGGKKRTPKEMHSMLTKDLSRRLRGSGIAGTVYPGPKGKGKGIALSRDWWQDATPKKRRNVLAHEAWHANVPILGGSEIAAHAYGQMRAKGGPGVGHLIKTRPGRFGMEAAGLLGTGAVATNAIKRVNNASEEEL